MLRELSREPTRPLVVWSTVEIEVTPVQHFEHATDPTVGNDSSTSCHDGAVSFSVIAPPLPRPVLFDQFWGDLTFVHWPVNPQHVAHLFPPAPARMCSPTASPTSALVPFVMRHTALGTSLRLPYFGSFAETNIRLYSIDDAGRHGVYFRSLETPRLAVVGFTRTALGVPYTWAKMRVTRTTRDLVFQRPALALPRAAQHADGPDR